MKNSILKIGILLLGIVLLLDLDNHFQESASLRRIKLPLSPKAQELKAILDDPSISEIEDEKLLVGGILDELLEINGKYEVLYKQKAKPLLIKIHREVKENVRKQFPQGIWRGEKQGLLNVAIIVRQAIDEDFKIDFTLHERIPDSWHDWLKIKQKLGRAAEFFPTNDIIRAALAPELYPNKKDEPHLHEWEIINKVNDWDSEEGRRIIRETVPHILVDHMGLQLDESFIGEITNWSEWATQWNVWGFFSTKFGGRARLMLKYVFPEKFYDYSHPERPHVWHDWDFHIGDWDTEEGDLIAYHFIRHRLFDPEHGEGWAVEGLAQRRGSWNDWANEDGKFASMVRAKFGSILPALKFALREEIEKGLINLGDFRVIHGRGVAELDSPLVELKRNRRGYIRRGIEGVYYGFDSQYLGYYVNRLSEDLGGLWKKIEIDTQGNIYTLVKIFPLIDHPGPSKLFINATPLLRDPPQELIRYVEEMREGRRLPVPEEKALQILRDEFGIDVSNLNASEKVYLVVALNEDRERLENYLRLTEPLGVTVLGNMSKPWIAMELAGRFEQWSLSFMRYVQIHRKIRELSKAFGLDARGIRQGKVDPGQIPQLGKYAPILLREAIESEFKHMNNSILEKIYKVLNDPRMPERSKRRKINQLMKAQENLLLLAEVLGAFRNGESENFREIKEKYKLRDDGAQERWFRFRMGSIEKQVRLVTRSRESEEGDAGISFSIAPYSEEEVRFRIELGWDDNLERSLVHINIDLRAFTDLLEHFLPLAEEHELKLAEEEIFSWLVRMVY